MAKLPLSLTPTGPYKNKDYPFAREPNGISFWAFLVSIFIYISIFYIFNLSPSTLFATPKFWFFISNTLVLIIAADSGAFSSSKQDLHEEYTANSRARDGEYSPSFVVIEKSITPAPPEVENPVEKNVVVHETKLEVVLIQNDSEKDNEFTLEDTNTRRIPRSKSDKVVSGKTKGEENKVVLRRSETETEKNLQESDEENDEFSSMSDEELNRRIEEFIQRFNREIRASRDQ